MPTPTLWQATISFGRPGQTKTDPELTEHLRQAYATSDKAVRGVKHLWGESLQPHSSFESKLRKYNSDMTFEGIGGIRLCAEGEKEKWLNKMQQAAEYHKRITQDWLNQYDIWLEQERHRQNGAFRIEDYPSRETLAGKFKFVYAILPMPMPNQFIRDALTDELGRRLADDYEQRLEATTKQIRNQVLKTLLALIGDTAESLANDGPIIDSENKKGPFAKLHEYLERIPALNITNDPTIAAIATEARNRLDFSVAELRKNGQTRQLAAVRASNIALQFGQSNRKIEKAA
jgi:hypothetical protein